MCLGWLDCKPGSYGPPSTKPATKTHSWAECGTNWAALIGQPAGNRLRGGDMHCSSLPPQPAVAVSCLRLVALLRLAGIGLATLGWPWVGGPDLARLTEWPWSVALPMTFSLVLMCLLLSPPPAPNGRWRFSRVVADRCGWLGWIRVESGALWVGSPVLLKHSASFPLSAWAWLLRNQFVAGHRPRGFGQRPWGSPLPPGPLWAGAASGIRTRLPGEPLLLVRGGPYARIRCPAVRQ
jgi:hypothetical protein